MREGKAICTLSGRTARVADRSLAGPAKWMVYADYPPEAICGDAKSMAAISCNSPTLSRKSHMVPDSRGIAYRTGGELFLSSQGVRGWNSGELTS